MKYKFGFIALISAFVMSFSYVKKADFRPPGTVEFVDNFFYDVNELTNTDWREYLSFLKVNEGKDSAVYKNAMPDTTVWMESGIENAPLMTEYLNNPAYGSYPVVGVTQKQAMDYCNWRTGAVKTMLKANDIDGPLDFNYRLPSRTEWELMANAGYDDKAKKSLDKQLSSFDKNLDLARKALVVNMKFKSSNNNLERELTPNTITPVPVVFYLPNKYGVYNINGNVAEMVKEPGIAMGGSFIHYYEDIIPSNKEIKYDGPKKWLGFRCVCEVKQR